MNLMLQICNIETILDYSIGHVNVKHHPSCTTLGVCVWDHCNAAKANNLLVFLRGFLMVLLRCKVSVLSEKHHHCIILTHLC